MISSGLGGDFVNEISSSLVLEALICMSLTVDQLATTLTTSCRNLSLVYEDTWYMVVGYMFLWYYQYIQIRYDAEDAPNTQASSLRDICPY